MPMSRPAASPATQVTMPHACRNRRWWLAVAACWAGMAGSPLRAAPPTLTQLTPAGAQIGQTIEVVAAGEFKPWPATAAVSGSGVTFEPAQESGKFKVRVDPQAEPGVRLVRITHPEGASAALPFIVGTLPELAEAETNDLLARPQPISLPAVTVSGLLAKAGDVDMFALPLAAGQTLVARLEAHETLASPMDAVLQVSDERGNVLAQNDDGHGLDPLLVYTARSAGTHVVRLFAFPATPNSTIGFSGGPNYVYRLTLSTQGVVDHALPVAVSRGTPGRVELCGWNLTDAGRILDFAVPSGGGTFVAFRREWGGAFPVAVIDGPTAVESEPNDLGAPQPLEGPIVVSGRIERPGDVDAFELRLKKGDKLAARIFSRELGFPLDPVLTLLDAAGKTLVRIDDVNQNRDGQLLHTIAADGVYRLRVQDLYGHGGPRYVYRLHVARATPDFSLALTGDHYVLPVGKSVEIPITVDRQNGLADEIEVRVEGLPEGITAEPVRSLGKGDTAKAVKLVLRGRGPAAPRQLRIVGTSRGSPVLTRDAEYVHSAFGGLGERLWLTAPPR